MGRSDLGYAEVVFTVPAVSLRQATTTGLAILAGYPWALRALRVVTTEDFDRGVAVPAVPELSRQRVVQLINGHELAAVRVGHAWAVYGSAVRARTPAPAAPGDVGSGE